MPWVRIDDQFPHHPKVVGVGPIGIALQVAGLCYSSQYLTDGFIPVSAVATLLDFSELDEHAFNGLGGVCWLAVNKLVSSGMWEEVDGGYQIHDYLDYQPSRATILKDRADAQARMQRLRSGVVRANNERSSQEVHDTRTHTHTHTQGSNEPLGNPLVSPLPGGNLSPALENLIPSEQRAKGLSTPSEKLIAEMEPEPERHTQGTSVPKATSTTAAPRPNKSATAPSLTAEQRDKLVAKWSGVLSDVGERIDAALNHVAVKKAISVERYVDNWLRNDASKVAVPMAMLRGAVSLSPVSNGHGSPLPPLDPDDPEWIEKQHEREKQRQAARYSSGVG